MFELLMGLEVLVLERKMSVGELNAMKRLKFKKADCGLNQKGKERKISGCRYMFQLRERSFEHLLLSGRESYAQKSEKRKEK